MVTKPRTDLLVPVASIDVEAVERFSVSEVIERERIDDVKFWFTDCFKRVVGTLVEINVPATTLQAYKLKRDSVDRPFILEELGGIGRARIFIAHMFVLACRQGQGQGGFLRPGRANIGYVVDPNDPETRVVVYCSWCGSRAGWRFDVSTATARCEWCEGDQVVVSR